MICNFAFSGLFYGSEGIRTAHFRPFPRIATVTTA
jgi:hypothetical protein